MDDGEDDGGGAETGQCVDTRCAGQRQASRACSSSCFLLALPRSFSLPAEGSGAPGAVVLLVTERAWHPLLSKGAAGGASQGWGRAGASRALVAPRGPRRVLPDVPPAKRLNSGVGPRVGAKRDWQGREVCQSSP